MDGIAAILSPWAFHIGGRRTPLLTWFGSGTLRTGGGDYPLFFYFFPSSHSGTLRLDGLRATGGVQGTGCLCTSRQSYQRLDLSGTVYGGWRSTQDALFGFRLAEPRIYQTGPLPGYFDLYGRFRGPDLVMDDRGGYANTFRSRLRIRQASVTLHWDPFLTCKSACANAPASQAH